jgi:hypothetical protein
MNLPRSSYYYTPKEKKPDDPVLLKRIEELAEEFSRYGYRRITAQLHREGILVNHNPTAIHMASPFPWPISVSGVRDKLDGSSSVSMR